jgi:hypothetical protein
VNQPEHTQQPEDKETESELSTANKLGTIDNFNLEYIRTGGSLQVSTSQ